MGALTSLNANSGLTVPGKTAAARGTGRPDEMALNKIHPDPNNARRTEDENTPEGIEAQRELTEDIGKRGVKSPISLRPHPRIAGAYVINFGHRRFKAALDAGLATIPYFLDESFDSYDQVKENLLHRQPSVWALAEFVQRKLKVERQSKGQIAEGLGKSQHVVTELLTLANAPSCLHQAYVNGVTSPRTLYDLRRAYEEFPQQVDAWCDSGAKITRDTIQELLSDLRNHPVNPLAKKTDLPGGSAGSVENSQFFSHDVKIDENATPLEELSQPDAPQGYRSETLPPNDRDGASGCATQGTGLPGANGSGDRQMIVTYRGKPARVVPGATVKIIVDGEEIALEVKLSELEFKSSM